MPLRYIGIIVKDGQVADTFGYVRKEVAVGTLLDVLGDHQPGVTEASVKAYDDDGNVEQVYNALQDDAEFTAGTAIAYGDRKVL